MPKFRVVIAETQVFEIDVAAATNKDAAAEGDLLFRTTQRSEVRNFFSVASVVPLPDDADVENE